MLLGKVGYGQAMADKTIAPELSSESNLHVVPSGDFKTMPCPGVPTRMLPPVTSKVALGAVVPIPTLVAGIPAPGFARLPSTRLLLCDTFAPAPMAVAKLRPLPVIRVPAPRN